jgi:hypothetical protein
MFADGLAQLVAGAERVTIDDFHRPPPQEYYPSSFDSERFREHLLAREARPATSRRSTRSRSRTSSSTTPI